ncbi:hypothetical protein P4475_09420 [Halalkalibacterium halodurans]|uniref:hypothetical protein n=1 Tax=Halalkalibacterium halodurans TaxID=86665 RepID=UPI001F3DD4E5|nr:hypothetical protein [Halalkalibacterium halodurans]MED3647030.1 hypothetical protein [Halalkalibacterium halodurans]MED4161943.1 hypothetical protein [Halalkalibacterium halodurans]
MRLIHLFVDTLKARKTEIGFFYQKIKEENQWSKRSGVLCASMAKYTFCNYYGASCCSSFCIIILWMVFSKGRRFDPFNESHWHWDRIVFPFSL